MKITIKITECVPYTTVEAVAEVSISAEEIDQARFDVLGETVKRLRADVNRRITEEMERRGIVLGADGLRLERPNERLGNSHGRVAEAGDSMITETDQNETAQASCARAAGSANEWHSLTIRDGNNPIVRILSDEDFDREVSRRCKAYRNYPTRHDGRTDYSDMQACVLHFDNAPDELLLRRKILQSVRMSAGL